MLHGQWPAEMEVTKDEREMSLGGSRDSETEQDSPVSSKPGLNHSDLNSELSLVHLYGFLKKAFLISSQISLDGIFTLKEMAPKALLAFVRFTPNTAMRRS